MLAVLCGGCGSSESVTERDVTGLLKSSEAHAVPMDVAVHDLGSILAQGQTILHEFRIANPSDKPIQILAVQALTPCCSSIKERPDTIPARGTALLRIEFRPGFQTGRKLVEFVVETDESSHTSRQFAIVASLIGEVEVSSTEERDSTLVPNKSGSQSYRVLSRQAKGEGRGLPTTIATGPGIKARFASEGSQTERDGYIESTRDIAVELLPSSLTGAKRDTVHLAWSDGRDWQIPIAWDVKSRVSVAPSAVTMRGDERGTQKILVRSDDRPFRIMKVRGIPLSSCATRLPTEENRVHSLVVELDPRKIPEGQVGELIIETDHADAPTIPITILALPATRGKDTTP